MVDRISIAEFQQLYPDLAARVELRALVEPIVVYDTPQVRDGDFFLDRPQAEAEAGSFLFLGDLTINGSLINAEGDFGIAMIVEGRLRANHIVGGGSYIYVNRAEIPGVLFGFYNHGVVWIRSFDGPLVVNEDHDLNTFGNSEYVYVDAFDSPQGALRVRDASLDYEARRDASMRALAAWFKQTPWVEGFENASEATLLVVFEDGDPPYINWFDWIMSVIASGPNDSIETFGRFVAHVRAVFQAAASEP